MSILVVLAWVFSTQMVVANESYFEANVTAKMQHIMNEFTKDTKTANHPFNDVLVFVHSNFDIPVTQAQNFYRMWHGAFPRMIIFAEWSHERVHELHQLGIPAFKCPPNGNGRVAQIIMLKGLEKYHHPSFNGYMYLHDDLLLSPAKVLTLDKTKLWISNKMEKTSLEPWNKRGWGWYWWNDRQSGIDAWQALYNAHPEMEKIMESCTDSTIPPERIHTKESAGYTGQRSNAHTLYNGHSDFLYIPKSLVSNYLKYMGAMAQKEVFLESAVATWAKCFTPNYDENAIELEICTTWDYGKRGDIWKWGPDCSNNTVIIHPVKYSSEGGLKYAKHFLYQHRTPYMNVTF